MSDDDLSDLNRELLKMFKARQVARDREAAVGFKVGDRARVDAGKNGFITGTITKINRRKCIFADDGSSRKFDVPMGMLMKI